MNPAPGPQLMQLRVRLRPDARVQRHLYRGEPWYVIQDPVLGRAHRLSAQSYEVLGLLDGQRTLQEAAEEAAHRLGDEAPSPEELTQMVATLYRADLLTGDALPDLDELAVRGARMRSQRFKQYFLNPLALRFPLIDPDRFLVRVTAALAVVPRAAWVVLWLAVVLAGALVAAANWSTLTEGFADRIFSAENLVLLWFCYPAVKLLHELAHGVMIRRYGGQVHEMGVMLLVLIPIPYVDASAATAFPSKRARMLVGAAGILTELFIAGIAMLLWAVVEPGAVRAICFNVAVIAGISTLVFNGNPLLRFDGYYILADWLEIPNLGQRATAHLGYLVQRYAFGSRSAQSPATTPGEARWFLAFGLASSVYRVFVAFGIALLVATQYFFIGVLLALWAVYTMMLRPLIIAGQYLAAAPQLAGRRGRALGATAAAIAVLAVALALPAPQWTRAEGVVWTPEHAQVRAGAACFVEKVVAVPGQAVRRGDLLVECEDPELDTTVAKYEAQLVELRARDLAYYVESRLHLDVVREEIAHVEARLANARERVAALRIRSTADGRFVMPQPQDALGRFLRRGELVAYVVEPGPGLVRAVVGQDDVDLVRGATREVAVKPADRVTETFVARVQREVPGASDRLPSAALAVSGGGLFGVDPRAASAPDANPDQPKALTPVFQFDLEVPAEARFDALGMRVYVRFDHEPAPLALQFYRAARRLMLRHFEV